MTSTLSLLSLYVCIACVCMWCVYMVCVRGVCECVCVCVCVHCVCTWCVWVCVHGVCVMCAGCVGGGSGGSHIHCLSASCPPTLRMRSISAPLKCVASIVWCAPGTTLTGTSLSCSPPPMQGLWLTTWGVWLTM